MDMIAVVTVTLTGLVVVLLRDSVTAAQSGLALSCVFAVSTFQTFTLFRLMLKLETSSLIVFTYYMALETWPAF